jgi:hypothetical protein
MHKKCSCAKNKVIYFCKVNARKSNVCRSEFGILVYVKELKF